MYLFFSSSNKITSYWDGRWGKMLRSITFPPFDIKLVVKVFFSQITTNTSSLFSESLRHESCVLYPAPRDPYACEVCDKPFKTIASLKQHTKVRDHVNWKKLAPDSPVRKMQISCQVKKSYKIKKILKFFLFFLNGKPFTPGPGPWHFN